MSENGSVKYDCRFGLTYRDHSLCARLGTSERVTSLPLIMNWTPFKLHPNQRSGRSMRKKRIYRPEDDTLCQQGKENKEQKRCHKMSLLFIPVCVSLFLFLIFFFLGLLSSPFLCLLFVCLFLYLFCVFISPDVCLSFSAVDWALKPTIYLSIYPFSFALLFLCLFIPKLITCSFFFFSPCIFLSFYLPSYLSFPFFRFSLFFGVFPICTGSWVDFLVIYRRDENNTGGRETETERATEGERHCKRQREIIMGSVTRWQRRKGHIICDKLK